MSIVDLNKLNLDPGFWPTLDPHPAQGYVIKLKKC